MLKKYALVIAIGFSAILAFASLAKLNDLPEMGVSFADKIFHFGAYAAMTLVWFNYLSTLKSITKIKAIVVSASIAIVFGMVIEVLQGALTASRQADFNDVLANSAGALLMALFLWFISGKHVKKY